MRVEGSYTIMADRETVWAALLAPEALAACIPGCQSLDQIEDDTYQVVLKAGVGSITGTYTGKVKVVDRVPPDSFRMELEGKATGGSIKGEGTLTLSEIEGGTEIHVAGDAQVTGLVARVGQRLMGSASRLMMSQFFSCVKSRVENR